MINVHSYESMGTFDGPGLRLVVFLQGCPFRCLYCANPDTIDLQGGKETRPEYIVNMAVDQKPFFGKRGGVTFSGGEPFEQIEAVKYIAHEAHRLRLNVWCYTGWTWEQIMQDPRKRGLLAYIDVLVDGRFDLKQRSFELKWRGSKNQRVIVVEESLFKNEVVLLEE